MNDAYSINNIVIDDTTISAAVTVNWDSNVFTGHFPEFPIFPGALFIDISTEIIEIYKPKHQVKEIKNLKFLKPLLNESIQIEFRFKIEDCSIIIQCLEPNEKSILFKAEVITEPK
jgi:3-hydroxymyristoyl/3-hydroxydecanoyl-(acyl carrier protein) dehydratase